MDYAYKYNMPVAYFSNLAFIGDRLIDLLKKIKKKLNSSRRL